MVKLNNSDFEKIEDIIKGLGINYDSDRQKTLDILSSAWIETIGNKISKFSKVYEFNSDNVIKIACSDSIVANELYKEEERILKELNNKLMKTGIEIKGIKFDYRKWKEKNYEEET